MSVFKKRKINPSTIFAIIALLVLGCSLCLVTISNLIIFNYMAWFDLLTNITTTHLLYIVTGIILPVFLLLTTKIDQKKVVKVMLALALVTIATQLIISVVSAIAYIVSNDYNTDLWWSLAFDLSTTPGCKGLVYLLMTFMGSNAIQIILYYICNAFAEGCFLLSTIVCAAGFALRIKQLKNQDKLVEETESESLEETETAPEVEVEIEVDPQPETV